MSIKIKLTHAYSSFHLDVDLDLPTNGVTTFFGASGAGKSTLLRCIAGLVRADRGYIKIADELWQDETQSIFLPPHKRELGYVFQEPRLFPHLSVKANLQYGLHRTPEGKRYIKWDDVIEMLDIGRLLSRSPQKLSGGEQQRVAIGRALLANPKLLLMDEPLASLDFSRKQEVLPFIRALHNDINIPVFYVSHSLSEVLQITDNLVLVKEGKTLAKGPIEEVCSSLEVSTYFGDMSGSVIATQIKRHEDEFGLTCLSFSGGEIFVPKQPFEIGSKMRVHLLAKNIGIALQKPQETTSFLNIFEAVVIDVGVPDITRHTVQVKLNVGVPLLASISRKSLFTLRLEPGVKCYALIKAVSITK